MATHKGSEGTIKVGSNAVAELLSYSITESVDLIETTNIKDLNSGKFPPIIHAQAFCVDKTAKVPEKKV